VRPREEREKQPICGFPTDCLGTILESYDFWEEGTLAQLKAIRTSLIDLIIAADRGRIVKTSGDGMLVQPSNQCTSRFWGFASRRKRYIPERLHKR
jgi:hypothetical protein